MFKTEIEYENYKGVETTETFYFHLGKGELMEYVMIMGGDPITRIDILSKEGKTGEIVDLFKDLIRRSYGIPDPETGRFIKSKESLNDFVYSGAFDATFFRMASDTDFTTNFVNNVFPESIRKKLEESGLGAPSEQGEAPTLNRAMRQAMEHEQKN